MAFLSGVMSTNLKLCVWEGDWGLPSLDKNCLSVMAYCKFSCIPIEFERTNNPWKFSSESSIFKKILNGSIDNLPILTYSEEKITRVADIINFLKRNNWGTDYELSSKQNADAIAYTAMIEEKLSPALLHLWWVDKASYPEVTKPWYMKVMPFPLNYYMSYKKNKTLEDRLVTSHITEHHSKSEREAKIYADAKECLNYLSSKLGDKEYLFGDKPTSLDAIVFGHIAPLLKVVSPNATLSNHLKGCTNLCQMIDRILDTYFPLTQEEVEADRRKHHEEEVRSSETSEYNYAKQKIILSFLVAIGAMVSYALLSGLVQIDIGSEDSNEYSHRKDSSENVNDYDNYYDEDEKKDEES